MKLKHTALFALSLNVRVTDPAGRDAGAIIAPVLYVWLWIPAWLWGWWTASPKVARGSRIAGNGAEGLPRRIWRACTAVLFGPGWRDDLALIGWAGWLLIRDRGWACV